MCVDDVVRQGVKFGEDANFLLAERLGIEGRESGLVQTFCESCVHFDYTHAFIYPHNSECPTLSYLNPLLHILVCN